MTEKPQPDVVVLAGQPLVALGLLARDLRVPTETLKTTLGVLVARVLKYNPELLADQILPVLRIAQREYVALHALARALTLALDPLTSPTSLDNPSSISREFRLVQRESLHLLLSRATSTKPKRPYQRRPRHRLAPPPKPRR